MSFPGNTIRFWFLLLLLGGLVPLSGQSPHSVARQWNEAILHAIRHDLARPTVHARNLFHTSAAMYDAWAIFDETAETYFLGKTVGSFTIPFTGIPQPAEVQKAREAVMSYAVYRILRYRFRVSPGQEEIYRYADSLLVQLGFDPEFASTHYQSGDARALGNYLGEQIIRFGQLDGSRDRSDYANRYYKPVNPPLLPQFSGNADYIDPNRWQPLTLEVFIDQAGNIFSDNSPEFLSPEWGWVQPFALQEEDRTEKERDGRTWWVYHDPGDPPYLELRSGGGNSSEYQWGHTLVALWSAHLDPSDGVLWDISPASIGNNPELPTTLTGLRTFFKEMEGGDQSRGHSVNPHTGQPYAPQIVPRGDYTRVLAEFWADGPDSETPPGHWFTILNYVNDHPLAQKRLAGSGEPLDDLEWDVKAYFALGGAMHDAAIAAWSIKGWYDYVRPISAIRIMAELGQSTDPSRPDYSPDGIPLVPGLIEVVEEGDPLAGFEDLNVGKIKLYAWRGPDYIGIPETSTAGVGWILAEDWWPYQRPSFVTPPFAGYVSGHSTFSRAAAEVLTLLTGDPYFPGGLGEFQAPKNEFLVFEDGPSVDITLQWATYRDASDQTSLSRIWGGIHPPVDDIPGRLIGEQVGLDAFALAEAYFSGNPPQRTYRLEPGVAFEIFPNPVSQNQWLNILLEEPAPDARIELYDPQGRKVREEPVPEGAVLVNLSLQNLERGIYLLRIRSEAWSSTQRLLVAD